MSCSTRPPRTSCGGNKGGKRKLVYEQTLSTKTVLCVLDRWSNNAISGQLSGLNLTCYLSKEAESEAVLGDSGCTVILLLDG